MPLVLLCRLSGIPARRDHRVTWVDFVWPLLSTACDRDWRVFYLGGRPEVVVDGLATIRARLPALRIDGRSGFFDDAPGSGDNAAVVDAIERFEPDLLLVGMGMPRQERWILRNRSLLGVPAILACGACMEYIAGAVRTPPRWAGRWGLEWLFRLLEDPRRFAFRYIVEPWLIVAAHLARIRGPRRGKRRS